MPVQKRNKASSRRRQRSTRSTRSTLRNRTRNRNRSRAHRHTRRRRGGTRVRKTRCRRGSVGVRGKRVGGAEYIAIKYDENPYTLDESQNICEKTAKVYKSIGWINTDWTTDKPSPQRTFIYEDKDNGNALKKVIIEKFSNTSNEWREAKKYFENPANDLVSANSSDLVYDDTKDSIQACYQIETNINPTPEEINKAKENKNLVIIQFHLVKSHHSSTSKIFTLSKKELTTESKYAEVALFKNKTIEAQEERIARALHKEYFDRLKGLLEGKQLGCINLKMKVQYCSDTHGNGHIKEKMANTIDFLIVSHCF